MGGGSPGCSGFRLIRWAARREGHRGRADDGPAEGQSAARGDPVHRPTAGSACRHRRCRPVPAGHLARRGRGGQDPARAAGGAGGQGHLRRRQLAGRAVGAARLRDAAGRGGDRAGAARRGGRRPARGAARDPGRTRAAARARHLRAPGRALRQPRPHAAGGRARAAHPHHQPGAAGRAGRARAADRPARTARARLVAAARARGRPGGRGRPVRRPGAGGRPRVRAQRRQHRHRGRALPTARRHPARPRARPRAAAGHPCRRDPQPLDRPVPHPRGRPHRHRPAPHAAGRDRLELRPVHPGRAAPVGRAFRVPGRLRARGPAPPKPPPRLVEKSVVQDSDGSRRYQLLDTMREFGAGQLAQTAVSADPGAPPVGAAELRARHRDYYRDLAAAAVATGVGAEQTGWLAQLGAETDNLRGALDFSFTATGQQDEGLRLTTLLRPYWLMVGQFSEGRRWHDLAVAVNPGSGEHAWAVFGAGVLAVQQGDLDAGAPLLDQAAALAAASGDENLAAHVSDARGIVAFNLGDLETAQARYEAALASYERIGFGDPPPLAPHSRLASACILTGALDRAVQLCEECLRRCDETGEQWARGTALWVRGATRWLSGDITAAIADSLSCLRIKESVNDLHTIAMSFDLLSVCRVTTAEFELAAVLHGAGEALWTLLNAPVLMGPGYADIRKSAADTARAALGQERFEELLGRGLAMPLADALAMAKGERQADAALAGEPGPSAEKQLTRREKEIAALVAAGLGNREIAARLFLSKRTVDSHLEHIFTKLGFSSRTQLASWVLGQGKSH